MKTNKMDAKSIIKKLKSEDDERIKTSLYLSKTVYEGFKKSCGNLSTSRVLEELMKQFIEQSK